MLHFNLESALFRRFVAEPNPFEYRLFLANVAMPEGVLDGFLIAFSGPDPDRLIERGNEDLAVANLPGSSRRGDGFDRLTDEIGRHGDLDLQLGQKADRIFRPTVDFRVALLAAVTFDFGHGHPGRANRRQSVTNLVQLEWLNDRSNYFHVAFPARLYL